jgi:2-polyprenyl-3-methyl-5-hydroxy-6-metoxy-1,4-benzoquinol methylase
VSFEPLVPPSRPAATIDLETVSCPFCGSTDEKELFTGPDRLIGLPGIFREVVCRGCGLIRQNPRPTMDALEAYYPTSYDPYRQSIRAERNWWRRLDRHYGEVKRRRLIERYRDGGRLLDVGSATGNFLHEVKRTGRWDVFGIEPNAYAADYARRENGLDIRTSTLADAQLASNSFDVVTMWNVLEHVPEPIDDLHRVSRLLRPGGLLVLSLPNVESLEVKLFGPSWFGWELPRHLHIFPREVLRRMLDAAGFDLVRGECISGSQIMFALSVRCLYPSTARRPPWHAPLVRALESMPGRVIFGLPFYVYGRARQSMVITYVARKRQ